MGHEPRGAGGDRPGALIGHPFEQHRSLPETPLDLLRPASAQAGGTNDRHAERGPRRPPHRGGRENGLNRLSEPHLVGEQRAARPGEELGALPLIRVGLEPERGQQARDVAIGQDGAAFDAAVEPVERLGFDAVHERVEPAAELRLVPCGRSEREARVVERALHGRRARAPRASEKPGLHHVAKVKVDARPPCLALMLERESRSR